MGVYHAKLSPSGAFRWSSCTASPDAQQGYPNTTNPASRHGTCGHHMSAECLAKGTEPEPYLGRTLAFLADRREVWIEDVPAGAEVIATEVVTEEMIAACNSYIGFVRGMRDNLGAEMLVEQAVPIGQITGEADATGSSDCILMTDELAVGIDLKLGRGRVTAYDVVEPESIDIITGEAVPPKLRMNLQCAMYLLGIVHEHGLYRDFKRVRAVIVQPYLNAVSEYECDIEELLELGRWLSDRAAETRKNPTFVPNGENCHFCKAKFDCHARNREVLETALDGFDDVASARPKPITIPKLGDLYDKISMIREWCDDIEKRVTEELSQGRKVVRSDGKKFVFKVGRKPAKEWDKPAEVEALLKSWRYKDDLIYSRKLITPTQIEKISETAKGRRKPDEPKKPIGKIYWNRLQEHIVQGDPKPVVALETDPRPAYVPKELDMPVVQPDDLSDLL
jgi:hypothetical protein